MKWAINILIIFFTILIFLGIFSTATSCAKREPTKYVPLHPVSGEICINGTKYLKFGTYAQGGGITPKYVNGKLELCK